VRRKTEGGHFLDTFETFYQQTRGRFFNYLVRLVGDYDKAADIFQESYARYWEHYGRQEPSAGLLFTIGRNAVIDSRRRKGGSEQPYEDLVRDHQPDQETAMVAKESYRRVLTAMGSLKPLEREVLALAVDGEFTYEEIARITRVSVANVKVKVHRARQRLRSLLKEA
jgi:RNA polymerase sigma-70 factor (ECF subfamily)